MDFKNAQELLELCHTENMSISEIMKKENVFWEKQQKQPSMIR